MQAGASVFDEIKRALELECDSVRFSFLGKRSVQDYVGKLAAKAEVAGWWTCGEFAGFVAYYANDDTSRKAFVSMLWVSASQRQRGVGSILLRHVVEVCKARGFTSICLEVSRYNVAASNFYASKGFRVVGESAEQVEMLLPIV